MGPRPTRPVLRYYGGKWRLAPWVISHFPPHRTYVEPFGGAASVLMRKPRSYAEVYNDLDEEVVNVFRVLRRPALARQLRRYVELTPFARAEFEEAYSSDSADQVERARRTLIKAFMSFSSTGMFSDRARGMRTHASRQGIGTGFRGIGRAAGANAASDWARWPQAIPAFTERLRGVVIDRRPALDVMAQHDDVDTLHYVDPPYVLGTRGDNRLRGAGSGGSVYRHEMVDDDHRELLAFLRELSGMVVISGYPTSLYDDLLRDWTRLEREHRADHAKATVECLWLNSAVTDRLVQPDLWEGLHAVS